MGSEEGVLLKIGLHEGAREGCAERLGEPDGEFEGLVDVSPSVSIR